MFKQLEDKEQESDNLASKKMKALKIQASAKEEDLENMSPLLADKKQESSPSRGVKRKLESVLWLPGTSNKKRKEDRDNAFQILPSNRQNEIYLHPVPVTLPKRKKKHRKKKKKKKKKNI